jgi:hypothetical protein
MPYKDPVEAKKYNISHRTEILKNKREYYIKNRDEILANKAVYRQENKNLLLEKSRARRKDTVKNNKDKESNKRYRIRNRLMLNEKAKIKNKELYYDNKDKILQRHKDYKRNKYNTDPNFRLINNIRSRIHNTIDRKYKHHKSYDLLGCTVYELKTYLTKKFTKGMTWENRGLFGWHIDHIKPCASFDLTKESEQKKCFHYTNLQPLWWWKNLSKSASITN